MRLPSFRVRLIELTGEKDCVRINKIQELALFVGKSPSRDDRLSVFHEFEYSRPSQSPPHLADVSTKF